MKKRKLLKKIKSLERAVTNLQGRVTSLEARPTWYYTQYYTPTQHPQYRGTVTTYPDNSAAAPSVPPMVTIS